MNPQVREPLVGEDEPLVGAGDIAADAPVVTCDVEPFKVSYGPVTKNMRIAIPKSVNWRIRGIAKAERRNLCVVMEKVVADFLEVPIREPKPYIPLCLYKEDKVAFQWAIPSEQTEQLNARAMAEAREVRMLVLRALMDYIENSPDDPMKLMPTEAPVVEEKPSEEVSDVPDSDSEEPIPEDEGIEGFEEASE